MRKVSMYVTVMLISLFISFLMAGTSAVESNLSARRMENEIHTENNGAPAVEWNRTYGGTGEDSMFLGSRSVIETSDGGYAVVGRTTPVVGVPLVLLVKTDWSGYMQWNRTYGRQEPPNGDLASAVIQTSDGGYALAGASWNQARGAHDLFLVKTDAGGNMQWNLTYIRDTSGGYLDWGHAFSVIQTNDGGYMVGAGVRHHPDHPTGDWDGWLVKTDANGNVTWDKPYGGSSDEGVHEVLQTGDGGYIFVGTTLTYGSGSGDVWLVKTDGSGNQQWAKTFGGSNWEDGNSIAKTSDGGYVIGAATSSFGAGSWDFWLIKTDVNGNQQWNKTFGGANEDRAWSVVKTVDGGHALAGSTKSFGAGDSDFWIVKTDSLGIQEWNRTFGGAGYDDARSIVQTVDKGYAVAGYTNSFGAGSYDFLLVKLAGAGPRTWIVDDDGPADFHTIQEAINAASDGDTVFVRNGMYYENVVVNKTLNLRGENRNSTIVDGNNSGNVVTLVSNNANVSGFTFQHSAGALYSCIRLDHVSRCNIFSNIADNSNSSASGDGIFLQSSEHNNISDNLVINTWDGITFWGCSYNTISGNTVVNILYVGGTSIQFCYGSPFNQAIGNAFLGIAQIGIRCYQADSGSNVIIGNIVENYWNGIYADGSSNNIFYHNSIVNNTINQVYIPYSVNVWDNGYPSGGNFWSDYNGTDLYHGPYQNETGSDGIGDAPYVIDANNRDSYPFLQPDGWSENLTKLSFSLVPNPAYVGQTVTMIGNLTDRLGQPINNTKIDLYVNGILSGTLFTNSSGWFTASAKVNVAGTYNVTAVCTAQNYYPSSHMESLVVYEKLETKISFTFSPNPVGVGQWVLMAGNLTDTYDNLIGNAPLEMYVKSGAGPWKYIGNISTDSSGKIWAFGRVMSAGTYQIAVVYRGSYKHNLSYHIETLVVNP